MAHAIDHEPLTTCSQEVSIRTWPTIAALLAFTFLLPFSARAAEKGRTNRTTRLHVHVFRYDLTQQKIDKRSALGYDKAIIRLGGDSRFTKLHFRRIPSAIGPAAERVLWHCSCRWACLSS